MEFHKIWIEQCGAARGIEDEFGTDKALKYLVEEKFIDFLEAAEENAAFRAEIPAFVAEIKTIFEPWRLRECLTKARQTEPFNSVDYMDEEDVDGQDIEMLVRDDIRHRTRNLLMVERATEWLLEDGE